MMRKTYSAVTIIALTILLSGFAHADAPSNTATKISDLKQKITDLKQEATDKAEQIKEKFSSTSASLKKFKNDFQNAAEIRIGKKLNEQKLKVANPFESAMQNLKDLISRIQSRLSKMVADNIDTSLSTQLLETAQTKITVAETELTNLENLLAQDIPSATSTMNTQRKIVLQNIKTQSDKAKNAIKAAHQAIIDIVASLKAEQPKEVFSTSTTETYSTSTEN